MRFMMLVCHDPSVKPGPGERESMGPDTQRWVDEFDGNGVRIEGGPWAWPSQARTVRRRGGELSVTDGPFAETKESIAGYDILECRDMEHAVEVASKHPMAECGALEIRALESPWEAGG